MEFGIGIIGATGYIGRPYRQEIRNAGQDATIIALCARRQEQLAQAGREDNARLVTSNWREVVEHPDVNLVMVLTPDALHFEPVIHAANLGKHVFCEKPIGTDVAQARAMRDALLAAKVQHFVPYWTRYVPLFQRAKEIVESGQLGEIRTFVYRWHNPRPLNMPFTWRDDSQLSSAGSIADVGSHAYDTLRFILGQSAQRVLAAARVVMPAKPDLGPINLDEALDHGAAQSTKETPVRQGSAPDFANIVIEYENGLVGSLLVSHASYVRKGFSPELELHGTEGSIGIDRIENQILFADTPEPATFLERASASLPENRFREIVFPALRNKDDPTTPNINDGYDVQCFTDAAAQSARTGQWVEVNSLK